MARHIGRRKFLATLLSGAPAWPLAAPAQQPSMPVIGFLSGRLSNVALQRQSDAAARADRIA